jgi:cystathionine gamma-lyase
MRTARVAVDNSFVTPLGQRPLDLGADFAVASASKYLTGHSDLMLGYVAVAADESAHAVRNWRSLTGPVAGPFEVWLAHRSLATLSLRLERQCANALALAEHLAGHQGVRDVRYPGLPGDPAHEQASRHLEMFGSVINFSLASAERAEAFLGSCTLVIEATSFGGLHTTAERTRRWGYDDVPEGFIRMSVGCEASEDINADVTRALASL